VLYFVLAFYPPNTLATLKSLRLLPRERVSSIHRAAGKANSRQPSFRQSGFSETRSASYEACRFWYVLSMKIELLYFDECPNYQAALQALKQALLDEGLQSQIQLIAVNTNKEAQRV
jgi:hypothetical protein